MFYGEYIHTLDRKGRLVLPARFREISKAHSIEKFYITKGLDTCLFMFSEEEWHTIETRFRSFSFTRSEPRRFNRIFFSGAVEVIPDRQGRVLVPQYLKEYAAIKREVIIVGLSNRIEIWDKALWEEYYQSCRQSYEEVAEKLMEHE